MTGYPWAHGDELLAADLTAALAVAYANDAAAISTANQALASAQARLPIAVTLNWSAGLVVTAGTYILTATAPYAFNINSIDVGIGSAGGSFVAQVRCDSIAVGGLGAVQVNTVQKTRTIASSNNNTVNIGSQVDVVISAITGLPADSFLVINGVRTS
jgi:hypothetical protein